MRISAVVRKVFSLLMMASCSMSNALSVGDALAPLSIDSRPADFDYKVDGAHHLIFVYPINVSSWAVKKFHRKVIATGFCPQSIVNMSDRAWYAPLSLAEKELANEMKASPNPGCTVTADYKGKANALWGLSSGPVAIVVDGHGRVEFIAYGELSAQQEQQVMALLGTGMGEQLADSRH